MAQLDKGRIVKCLEMKLFELEKMTKKQIATLLIREGFLPNLATFTSIDPKKRIITFSQ